MVVVMGMVGLEVDMVVLKGREKEVGNWGWLLLKVSKPRQ
jgi:hypothetical protein